jgi:dihydroorotase
MLDLVIQNCQVADPLSNLYQKQIDIGIKDGRIAETGQNLSGKEVWDARGNLVSPGWIDLMSVCQDPGEEWTEDLNSLAEAGRAGGYTTLCTLSGKDPRPDQAAVIQHVRRHPANGILPLWPIAAASTGMKGEDMAELFDLHQAGAVAFSDGTVPFRDAGVLMRVLEYAAQWKLPVFAFPLNKAIAGKGSVHEGNISVQTGLRAMPALAEETAVAEIIRVAEYLQCAVHISRISAGGSVALVREAKSRSALISCDTSAMHLAYDDKEITSFDTNWKTMPPLRSAADRQALCAGVTDGTIDAVISNHHARHIEQKQVEWDYAAFGALGLQTTAHCLKSAGLDPFQWAQVLAHGPRRILGMEAAVLEPGAPATLTIFNPEQSWTFSRESNRSKSENSPFIGQTLVGCALASMHEGRWLLKP